MQENLVCEKCGQRFNNRQEMQQHVQKCTGKAEQAGSGRPLTRGAGGQSSPE